MYDAMYKYMHAHTYMCTYYSHALYNFPMILYTLSLHLHIVCSIHVIYMHCTYTYAVHVHVHAYTHFISQYYVLPFFGHTI